MASLALAFDILARDRASQTFDKVGRAADNAGKKGEGFGGAMKKAASVAAGAFAAMGAIDFFKDSIAEARESQKVTALTANVIKQTGGVAKVSAAQVGDLATAISNKTGIDDEAIQSGANLLLTFKNVRNEVGQGANIFDRATQAATDLSAAGFGDMSGASKMLGKALNDPLKGLTALGRAGVTFTDQQKKQIETLVKSGDVLGAQKIILGEVESQVGGAAAASSTAGEKMATAFGNFKEQVGTALLPIIDKLATFMTEKVIPAMSKFVTEMTNGTGPGGEFRDMIEDVGAKVKDAAKWISENGDTVKALVVTLASAVAVVKTVTTVVNAWKVAQLALNVVMAANPVGLVIVAIAALAAGLIYAYKNSETFRNIVDGAFKAIGAVARWLWNVVFAPFIRFLLNGFAWITDGIANMLDALGNIPGFGWAKDAANKMRGAADKARDLAKNIKDIPETVDISITMWAKLRGSQAAINTLTNQAGNKQAALLAARASGGPVLANTPYLVGEKGPEIIVPKSSGMVLTADQTRAAMRSRETSGASGDINASFYIQGDASPKGILSELGWVVRPR